MLTNQVVNDGNLPARLLLPEELAELIRFHPESVRRAIRQGRIKAVKTGRHWKIPHEEARRVIECGL
jgi:excisionase family DNA binding protein